jgi:hypothetical protein
MFCLRFTRSVILGHANDTTPFGVERDVEFKTQGSCGGNPGLEDVTASRYLIRAS